MSNPELAPPAAGYAFGPFVVDSVRRTVWTEQAAIALPGKAFELLLVLIANRHRIIAKEELLAEIWPGTFVQENNLAKHVSTLRKALGEQPDEPDSIMTVQGRGYRFVAPVVELDSDTLALRARPHRVVPAEPGTDTLPDAVVPPEPTLRAPRRRVGLVLAASFALIAAVVVGVSYINAPRSDAAPKPWMLHQITYRPQRTADTGVVSRWPVARLLERSQRELRSIHTANGRLGTATTHILAVSRGGSRVVTGRQLDCVPIRSGRWRHLHHGSL